MNSALRAAAGALAEALEQENAALAALDLGQAAALFATKQAAADAFIAAQAEAAGTPDAAQRALAGRLRDLAEENRRLLEQGIRIQARVVGVVAKALPRPPAHHYGARGAPAQAAVAPVIVSARV